MMKKTSYLTTRNHAKKVNVWFTALRPFQKHWKQWDAKESALLVIDVQRYFFDLTSHAFVPVGPFVKKNIQALVEKFRAQGRPIIFTIFAVQKGEKDVILNWWKESVKEGSPAAALSMEVGNDFVVRKKNYSAFSGTDLETILKKAGVKKVVITGVLSNLCCETTARDAFNRGYDVFFVADATGAYNEGMHKTALESLSYGFATPLKTDDLL